MKTLRIPFTILCMLALSALSAHAAQLATAKVINVVGTVTKYAANGDKAPLKAGEILSQGDSVSATALSSALLVFSNGSEITVEENTSMKISKLEQDSFASGQSYEQLQADPSQSQTLLELNYGELGFHVKKLHSGSTFNIETPLGTAAVRGTKGFVKLFYNAERGEFVLMVKNFDGIVDIISRHAGAIQYSNGVGDIGYDGSISEQVAEPLPQKHTIVVRLARGDPYFEALFALMKNYIPTNPRPGWIKLPVPEITPDDPGVIVVSPEDQAQNE